MERFSNMARQVPPRQVPPPERRDGEERRSSYARFIPREELSSFAAWTPGSLSGEEEVAAAAADTMDIIK